MLTLGIVLKSLLTPLAFGVSVIRPRCNRVWTAILLYSFLLSLLVLSVSLFQTLVAVLKMGKG